MLSAKTRLARVITQLFALYAVVQYQVECSSALSLSPNALTHFFLLSSLFLAILRQHNNAQIRSIAPFSDPPDSAKQTTHKTNPPATKTDELVDTRAYKNKQGHVSAPECVPRQLDGRSVSRQLDGRSVSRQLEERVATA